MNMHVETKFEKIEEPTCLGQPVRLLPDAQLEAAGMLKDEFAAEAVAEVRRALDNLANAVGMAEILRYEKVRRAAEGAGRDLEAVVLLRMVAANLRMPDKDGGKGLLSEEQVDAILGWYDHVGRE